MTITFKVCDCCDEMSAETTNNSGMVLCPECHDINLVFCQLCGIAGFGDPTQDWTCKDCIDQLV